MVIELLLSSKETRNIFLKRGYCLIRFNYFGPMGRAHGPILVLIWAYGPGPGPILVLIWAHGPILVLSRCDTLGGASPPQPPPEKYEGLRPSNSPNEI